MNPPRCHAKTPWKSGLFFGGLNWNLWRFGELFFLFPMDASMGRTVYVLTYPKNQQGPSYKGVKEPV